MQETVFQRGVRLRLSEMGFKAPYLADHRKAEAEVLPQVTRAENVRDVR